MSSAECRTFEEYYAHMEPWVRRICGRRAWRNHPILSYQDMLQEAAIGLLRAWRYYERDERSWPLEKLYRVGTRRIVWRLVSQYMRESRNERPRFHVPLPVNAASQGDILERLVLRAVGLNVVPQELLTELESLGLRRNKIREIIDDARARTDGLFVCPSDIYGQGTLIVPTNTQEEEEEDMETIVAPDSEQGTAQAPAPPATEVTAPAEKLAKKARAAKTKPAKVKKAKAEKPSKAAKKAEKPARAFKVGDKATYIGGSRSEKLKKGEVEIKRVRANGRRYRVKQGKVTTVVAVKFLE